MNRLSHLLTITAEESVEIAQRATKSLRFGIDDVQEGHTRNNAERLIGEFNDLYASMEMLKEDGAIGEFVHRDMIEAKKLRVEQYLEYSKRRGLLDAEEA